MVLGIDNLCGFKLIVTFGLHRATPGLRPPLVSSGLPDFKFYDSLFYLDYKYKGLRRRAKPGAPENIHELLTPRALAYWFMDDGNSYQNGRHRAYMFSTHSFP